MDIKEAMLSGKRVRRKTSKNREFGLIVENHDGTIDLDTSVGNVRLGLLDILATDWEAKRELRIFWVGMKIYRHTHYGTGKETEHKFMMAVEGENAPESPTDDGQPWAKVVEVSNGSQE